jgi:integral membrane protein
MESTVKNLRIIGIFEGISFLVLLIIAMPLKYFLGFPEAVKFVGWIHGVLFIAYVIAVFLSIRAMRWGLIGVAIALGASLLPLGTFLLDKQLKRRQEEIAIDPVR